MFSNYKSFHYKKCNLKKKIHLYGTQTQFAMSVDLLQP